MIQDRTNEIAELRVRVTRIGEYLHLDAKRAEVANLEAKAAEPGFWDDSSSAQGIMSSAAGLRD